MQHKQKTLPVAGAKGDTLPRPPEDLWDILDVEINKRIPPEGSVTIAQIAEKYGISISAADGRVATLVRKGKLVYLGKFGNRNEKHYGLPS